MWRYLPSGEVKTKKVKARARKGKKIRQVAALPFRLSAEGDVQIMLVTSRETGRFILPKGWPMKGLRDSNAAAQEAEEEAGVIGSVNKRPVGSFRYWKRLKTTFVPIVVDIYPVHVSHLSSNFREKSERGRAWLKPEEAALLVDEPELVTFLQTLDLSAYSAPDGGK